MGPLAGIEVLEMANFISGPYAATLLGDLGASVIKVELPGSGDPYRAGGGVAPQFAAYNRNKHSITVDVRTEGGREVYARLTSGMDVIVDNFRPGTLDKLGVGYDALSRVNPGLVYCAVSGMGSTGPYRDRPSYDAIAQAVSGLWSQFTDMDNPQAVGPASSDQLTGLHAALGIAGALVARGATGQGQKIEVSMLSASLSFLTGAVAQYRLGGHLPDRYERSHRSQSYAFTDQQGLPFAIHLSTPPKFWQGLTEVAGKPDLQDDPRFNTYAARVSHYDELRALLQDVFRTASRGHWLALLQQHDVPSAPINTVAEALEDPQVKHLGLEQLSGEGDRAASLLAYPVEFAGTPVEPALPPPRLGEHTAGILSGLGYSQEDLQRLHAEGAI